MSQADRFRQPLIDMFNRNEEGKRHVRFFSAIPDELIDYMPGFWWNQSRLFALELNSTPLSLSTLDHLLTVPIWRSTNQSGLFSVTGREILASPGTYKDHWNRVIAADISYPIILYRRGDLTILLDGYHRLLKTIYLERLHIDASYLAPQQLQEVLEHDGFLGELNAISQCDPNFIAVARTVARELLHSDNANQYPLWS